MVRKGLRSCGWIFFSFVQLWIGWTVISDMWEAGIRFFDILMVGLLFLIWWLVIVTDAQPTRTVTRKERDNA